MPARFRVEYASTGRASCKKCKSSISKGQCRLGRIVPSPKEDGQDWVMWHHVPCLFKINMKVPLSDSNEIEGFDTLKPRDQEIIEKHVAGGGGGQPSPKKKPPRKRPRETASSSESSSSSSSSSSSASSDDSDSSSEEEKEPPLKKPKLSTAETNFKTALGEETTALEALRGRLESRCTSGELKRMLLLNGQPQAGSLPVLARRCAEGLLFGALPNCPECGGTLEVAGGLGVRCTAWGSEWGRCGFQQTGLARKKWKLKGELEGGEVVDLMHENDFLKGLKVKQRERAVPPPEYLKRKKEAQDLMDQKRQEARETQVAKSQAKRTERGEEPAAAPSFRLRLREGGEWVLDPESGLADRGYTLVRGKHGVYSTALSLVDLVDDLNSYHVLQLATKGERYRLWERWGRIGSRRGDNRESPFGSLSTARGAFEEMYERKTGNAWGAPFVKKVKGFAPLELGDGGGESSDEEGTRKRKREGDDGGDKKKSVDVEPSTLVPEVQRLMGILFDRAMLRETMLSMQIDVNKLPMGHVAPHAITKAFHVLKQLEGVMQGKPPPTSSSRSRSTRGRKEATEASSSSSAPPPASKSLLELSNQFYTLVPHVFSSTQRSEDRLIKTLEVLAQKVELLSTLGDIGVAEELFAIPRKPAGRKLPNPLDVRYAQLRAKISPVGVESKEHAAIVTSLTQCHAPTHRRFRMHVRGVYAVGREAEGGFVEDYGDEPRRMLWHGSRVANCVGIVSKGLRIAPPEAPSTGSMFGKGIYFADIGSKSAQYCHVPPGPSFTTATEAQLQKHSGLLLLCEVAVGKPYEALEAEDLTKPPKGYHSTKGCGQWAPPESGAAVFPCGAPLLTAAPTKVVGKYAEAALLYNEYVVYDVKRLRIAYLAHVYMEDSTLTKP